MELAEIIMPPPAQFECFVPPSNRLPSSLPNGFSPASLVVLHPGWSPAGRKVRWRKVRTPQGSAPHDECGQVRRKPCLTESVTENIPPGVDPGSSGLQAQRPECNGARVHFR